LTLAAITTTLTTQNFSAIVLVIHVGLCGGCRLLTMTEEMETPAEEPAGSELGVYHTN